MELPKDGIAMRSGFGGDQIDEAKGAIAFAGTELLLQEFLRVLKLVVQHNPEAQGSVTCLASQIFRYILATPRMAELLSTMRVMWGSQEHQLNNEIASRILPLSAKHMSRITAANIQQSSQSLGQQQQRAVTVVDCFEQLVSDYFAEAKHEDEGDEGDEADGEEEGDEAEGEEEGDEGDEEQEEEGGADSQPVRLACVCKMCQSVSASVAEITSINWAQLLEQRLTTNS